ncbi:hypothetical protein [Gemmatimonas sp.]|mgnify:FL=1|uniref:hypothetical protein n=1 Tax=Gemmatimonas sp. TaxID=1962908 RepID=UPI0033417821
MNAGEIKNQAVINNATEQFRSLLETHFIAIARSAEESFVDDEMQTEPKAKATFAVEWDALSLAPKVVVKIGWSVRYKDESEAMVDPLQSKLGLVEDTK